MRTPPDLLYHRVFMQRPPPPPQPPVVLSFLEAPKKSFGLNGLARENF